MSTLDDLRAKLKARKGRAGYASNVALIERRIAELEAEEAQEAEEQEGEGGNG